MSKKENISELIDAYLSGSLSEHEVSSFEQRLLTDENFRTEYEWSKVANDALMDKFLLEEKAWMRNFDYGQSSAGSGHKELFILAALIASFAGLMLLLTLVDRGGKEYVAGNDRHTPIEMNHRSERDLPTVNEKSVTNEFELTEKQFTTDEKAVSSQDTIFADHLVKVDEEATILDNTSDDTVDLVDSAASGPDSRQAANENNKPRSPDCSQFKVSPSQFFITSTESGVTNGTIKLTTLRLGDRPIKSFAIPSLEVSTEGVMLVDIPKGEHQIVVLSDSGCKALTKVLVPEKRVRQEVELTLDRDFQAEVTFPDIDGMDYVAKIVSKELGTVAVIDVEGETSWNGYDTNGNILTPGYYPIFITLSNGEALRGGVTILDR